MSRLGASLAPLKSAKADFGHEIGIPQDVGTSKQLGTYGTLVSDVQPGSLAHNIGFRPGDIILYVGKSDSKSRSPVHGLEDMKADLDQLDQHQPGSQVRFTIKRWYFHKGWREGALEGKIDN